MKLNLIALTVATAVLAGCASTASSTHQDKYHDKHEHHEKHDHYGWSYEQPEKWGDLEVNKLCSVGVEQSPINIEKVQKIESKVKITENYQAQNFKVSNNGHSIVFDVDGDAQSTVNVNGTDYKLLQFHYHIPSEHTVMNKNYPLEIHFVHQNAQGNLAVVGVLVNHGQHNASLEKILTGLPTSKQKTETLTDFNIGRLMPTDGATYAYDGSLTTPPCSEKVQWLLKANPIELDSKQLATLAKLYDGNNRPVQPQGNREVILTK